VYYLAVSTILVVAAILLRGGEVLLTQRKAGTHLAGAWEFPGGKVEAGEDPKDALGRELSEELGIRARIGDILEVTFHRYPERAVLLLFYRASLAPDSAEPTALDVAAYRWASQHELRDADFPAADVVVLQKVRRLLSEDAIPDVPDRPAGDD
jgi:8-oxo-dGTP diphosphatase